MKIYKTLLLCSIIVIFFVFYFYFKSKFRTYKKGKKKGIQDDVFTRPCLMSTTICCDIEWTKDEMKLNFTEFGIFYPLLGWIETIKLFIAEYLLQICKSKPYHLRMKLLVGI